MTKDLTVAELAVMMIEAFQNFQIYIDERFRRVEERLDRIEARLDTLETRVTALESRVTNIETRVTGIENTMSTRTQVETLTDILRTNGVLSAFETSQVAAAVV